jgi:hypothetical protein
MIIDLQKKKTGEEAPIIASSSSQWPLPEGA